MWEAVNAGLNARQAVFLGVRGALSVANGVRLPHLHPGKNNDPRINTTSLSPWDNDGSVSAFPLADFSLPTYRVPQCRKVVPALFFFFFFLLAEGREPSGRRYFY